MLNETDLATGLMLFGPLVAISLSWLIGWRGDYFLEAMRAAIKAAGDSAFKDAWFEEEKALT